MSFVAEEGGFIVNLVEIERNQRLILGVRLDTQLPVTAPRPTSVGVAARRVLQIAVWGLPSPSHSGTFHRSRFEGLAGALQARLFGISLNFVAQLQHGFVAQF